MSNVNLVEYFENVLHSQPKVDNWNMSHREIMVLVGYGHNIDVVRTVLWKLCEGYESKLGLEYSFNDSTKIFAIIKRDKEKIYMIRVYIRMANKISLAGYRPDMIVAYGSFSAKQCGVICDFIQHVNKPYLEVEFLDR